MKKVICIFICIALLTSCIGCAKEEPPTPTEPEEIIDWMPFDLKFGMTYDDFAAAMARAGFTVSPLTPADDNDGYVVEGIPLDINNLSHWDFLHSELINKIVSSDNYEDPELLTGEFGMAWLEPTLYFSFNQSKQLYEFYFFGSVLDEDFTKMLRTEFVNAYNDKFEFSCNSQYAWNTETMKSSISIYHDDTFCFVLHNIPHNLTH